MWEFGSAVTKKLNARAPDADLGGKGERSAYAIAEFAIKAGAEVEFTESDRDGRTRRVRVTPPRAIEIRERIVVERSMRRGAEEVLRVDDIAERLIGLSGPGGVLSPEAREVVRVIVAGIQRSGAGSFLDALASTLEFQGYYDIAATIRGETSIEETVSLTR